LGPLLQFQLLPKLEFDEFELAIVKIVQEILISGGINFMHKNLP